MMLSPDQLPPAVPAAPPGRRTRLWIERLATMLCCPLLFALCFWLYTRHNTFSLEFHPDEPNKVELLRAMVQKAAARPGAKPAQGLRLGYPKLATEVREFKHPMLLMEATVIALRLKHIPADDAHAQAVVEAGRSVSAMFAALAVVALALIGYRFAGTLGFAVAGLTVGLCPALLIYAHYMKEDAPLVFGMAMVLLGSCLFWFAESKLARGLSLVLLGIACGLAASAKYSGLVCILAVLPLLFRRPVTGGAPFGRIRSLLEVAVVVVLAINFRAVQDTAAFKDTIAPLQAPPRWGRH